MIHRFFKQLTPVLVAAALAAPGQAQTVHVQQGQDWSSSHVGPMHAAMVWNRLGRPTAIPMHWGTFRLSWERYLTPPRMLRGLLECAGAEGFFHPLRHGQSIEVPQVRAVPPLDEERLQRCARTPAIRALE